MLKWIVGIEIDSGAEVICLLATSGAGTLPPHETRLSMCGGYHAAAGGRVQCPESGVGR